MEINPWYKEFKFGYNNFVQPNEKNFQITIDGPVGAGKSTVAKEVADRLNILYIDTGAMYRAMALFANNNNVKLTDEKRITELVGNFKIEMHSPSGDNKDGRKITVIMGDKDISWDIRQSDLGEGASLVSQYSGVRERLVSLQQELARGQSVVMEGRDIGTRVLPDAEIKIYMDADVEERVVRKIDQLKKMGILGEYDDVKRDIATRDNREMTREIDPLRPAKDAWILDTTDLSVDEVVDRIVLKVEGL